MTRQGQLLRRHRDFRRLWTGETVSAVGSRVTLLALPLLAVEQLGATPWQMGVLGAAPTVPFLLLSLGAGLWVDRRRRRPVLVAAQLARAALLGLVPLLAWTGVLRMTHLVVIAFALGACAVFFELAFQSYLPWLLPRADLVAGNATLSASGSVAEAGGPGLAGAAIGALTAPVALLLDALSFLVSAVGLARIDRREPEPEPPPAGARLWSELGAGFRETFGNRYLLAFAGEAATYNVAWNAMNALLVLWAVRELGLSVTTLGVLLSIGGIGALIGALTTGPLARRIGVGPAMWGSALLSNAGVLLVPLAGGVPPLVLATLGAGFFLQGLGMTGTNVHTYAIRQAVTPDRVMGRANAVYRVLTYGFIPVGALLGGLLGETLGLHLALWVSALALFPSWLWLFFSPARSLRDIPAARDGRSAAVHASGA